MYEEGMGMDVKSKINIVHKRVNYNLHVYFYVIASFCIIGLMQGCNVADRYRSPEFRSGVLANTKSSEERAGLEILLSYAELIHSSDAQRVESTKHLLGGDVEIDVVVNRKGDKVTYYHKKRSAISDGAISYGSGDFWSSSVGSIVVVAINTKTACVKEGVAEVVFGSPFAIKDVLPIYSINGNGKGDVKGRLLIRIEMYKLEGHGCIVVGFDNGSCADNVIWRSKCWF